MRRLAVQLGLGGKLAAVHLVVDVCLWTLTFLAGRCYAGNSSCSVSFPDSALFYRLAG